MKAEGGRTYVIAEMACSHEGDPSLARRIIDAAREAGADAIQFQIWAREDVVVPHHPDWELIGKLEIPREDWSALAAYARARHPAMHIIACIYDLNDLEFCETIGVDAYKIHAADLSNPYLIQGVARTRKRVELSVGGSTLDEIQAAVEWVKDRGAAVWLMYGKQNFPTRPEAAHLAYMKALKALFELPVGYQDHSDADTDAAFWLPAAALGIGVEALEKHITHDRSLEGADHQAALNPDEFSRFIAMVREIDRAMGESGPQPLSEDDLRYRRYSKKSIVARHNLAPGTRLGLDDLAFMRADALGLAPSAAPTLVGRTTRQAIRAHQLVMERDLE